MNPKVFDMVDKVHPEIRCMSKDEGIDFIVWLVRRNIDMRKLISYSYSKQLDLLKSFRKDFIIKECKS